MNGCLPLRAPASDAQALDYELPVAAKPCLRSLVEAGEEAGPLMLKEPSCVEASSSLHTDVLKGINPTKLDSLTHDPFGVRERNTLPCQVESLPDPTNPVSMGTYLQRLDKAELGERLSSPTSNGLTPLINYVWVGSQLKNDDFRRNVESWRVQYTHFEVVIWTDQTEFDAEMIGWCKENNVRMINIYEAIPQDSWMGVKDLFSLAMTKMRPNYGEASDILRYVLLYNFGGIYADTDTKITYLDHRELAKREMPEGLLLQLDYRTQEPSCNDCFFAKPKQPFFADLISEMKRKYSLSMDEMFREAEGVGIVNPFGLEISETVGRTGPYLVRVVFKRRYELLEGKDSIKLPTKEAATCTGSWLYKSRLVLHCLLSKEMVEKVVTELLWDLKNRPNIFNLNKFEPWIERAENPDQFRRELYFLIKEKYPALFERIEYVEVKDPILFQEICLERGLDQTKMGEAFLDAVMLNHIDMVKYFVSVDKKYLSYQSERPDQKIRRYNAWCMCWDYGGAEVFEYLMSVATPKLFPDEATYKVGKEQKELPVRYVESVIKAKNIELLEHLLSQISHDEFQFCQYKSYHLVAEMHRDSLVITDELVFSCFYENVWRSTSKIPESVLMNIRSTPAYVRCLLDESGDRPDVVADILVESVPNDEIEVYPIVVKALMKAHPSVMVEYVQKKLADGKEIKLLFLEELKRYVSPADYQKIFLEYLNVIITLDGFDSLYLAYKLEEIHSLCIRNSRFRKYFFQPEAIAIFNKIAWLEKDSEFGEKDLFYSAHLIKLISLFEYPKKNYKAQRNALTVRFIEKFEPQYREELMNLCFPKRK